MYNFFLASSKTLDERTKKVLLVLCALFIILLLIMGSIYVICKKYMERESKKIDSYMFDLIKSKIVNNPKQFKKAFNYHEIRAYFKSSSLGWWLLILLTGALFGLAFLCFSGDYTSLFTKAKDILPIIKWQSVAAYNEELKEVCELSGNLDKYESLKLSGVSFLPASVFPSFVSRHPDFTDIKLYISVIYYVASFFALNILIKAVLAHIGRTRRANKKVRDLATKSLDNISFDTKGDVIAQAEEQ